MVNIMVALVHLLMADDKTADFFGGHTIRRTILGVPIINPKPDNQPYTLNPKYIVSTLGSPFLGKLPM